MGGLCAVVKNRGQCPISAPASAGRSSAGALLLPALALDALLMISGNEDFELLQVALGDAPLEVEHLDAHNLLPGVEVQHNARLQLLGLDNLRVVQAKVKRIGLPVVADSHIP